MFAGACNQDLSLRLQSPCAHTSELVSGGTNVHAILPVNGLQQELGICQGRATTTYFDSASTVFAAKVWTSRRRSQCGSSVAASCSPRRRWQRHTARSTTSSTFRAIHQIATRRDGSRWRRPRTRPRPRPGKARARPIQGVRRSQGTSGHTASLAAVTQEDHKRTVPLK